MKKTWVEKRDAEKEAVVKVTEKSFADIPAGSKMLIATPQIINAYLKAIPAGKFVSIATLREDLAIANHADKSCPLTTGIFLRIVAEAAYEELLSGAKPEEVAPFWRAVDPKSNLAKKLTCGADFLRQKRTQET